MSEAPKFTFPAAGASSSGATFGAMFSSTAQGTPGKSQAPAFGSTASTPTPQASSTPAQQKPLFTFGSTTPATPASSGILFGAQQQKPQTGTMAPTAQQSTTSPALPTFGGLTSSSTSTPAPTGTMFGGGLTLGGLNFGTKSTAASTSSSTPATATPTLGAAPAKPSTVFGMQAGSGAGAKPLFGGNSAAPALTLTPASTSSSLQSQQSSSGQTPAATSTSAAPAASNFGVLGGGAGAATSQPAASSTTGFTAFGALGQKPAAPSPLGQFSTTSSSAAAPGTSTPSFFGGAKPAGTAAPTATTTSMASASKPSIFGATTTTAPAGTTAAGTLGASTIRLGESATAIPPASSRLKNKSMDEILTRWASDLSRHQKDFAKHAGQVAEWDRTLVENTDKISKLLVQTIQAERDASEVDKQLNSVETQQDELDQWLDRYEKEVDGMFDLVGLSGESGGGVDLERERTYKLAEKLTERLDDLSKDLADVVDEINGVSSMLSNASGADDPLSHVVRVLNSHLTQLQKIDTETASLQAKVKAAEREQRTAGTNGWKGMGNDPADEFYRSYMSRR